MRKEAGWQWYHSIGLTLGCSRGNYKCLANPVSIICRQELFPNNGIVSELHEKKLACHVANSNSYWFFADTPNIGKNFCVIWKDLWWWADPYHRFKYRGGCTIPLIQISVWCENCAAARHYADIRRQLLFVNNRNRVRGDVLGLSHRMGPALICLKISVWIA